MTASLAQALVDAQAAMPRVEPDATNPHFRSKFVSLDHLIAEVRPVLNLHGISVTQWPTSGPDGQPMLETRLTHVSGETMSSVMPLLVGKNDMQGLGGAITYARRYMLAAALGISAEEDDDGAAASSSQGRAGAGSGDAAPKAADVATREEASAANPLLISEPQRKRLRAIQNNHHVPDDEAKKLVKQWGGVDSSKLLPRNRYDAVVAALEAWTPPETSFADQIPVGARGDA